MKKREKALAALGLAADATDEAIFEAAGGVDTDLQLLGAEVITLTDAKSPDAAIATARAWRDSHDRAATERAELAAERAKDEATERVELLTKLIVAGWERPPTAWALDEDGRPITGTPSEAFESMSIEALRARAKTLCAQPRAHVGDDVDPSQPDGSATLTVLERQWCEAKGIDPALFAQNKSRVQRAFTPKGA